MRPLYRVMLAAAAFRGGAPVAIHDGKREVLALAAETLDAKTLSRITKNFGAPLLALTHARARTLKIRLYTPDIVAIAPETLSVDGVRAIADPASDLDYPMKGPFDTARAAPGDAAKAAVKLAKLAGLLPAALFFPSAKMAAPADAAPIAARDILSYDQEAARSLSLVVRARVPLAEAEDAELAAFRPKDGGPEHYAIIVGNPDPNTPVLVRLHSECFTGDLLGSLKCDCGDQLRGAIAALTKAKGGVLLYLAQEGRGIGLMNKLRAYRLQNEGFDTFEANERLGFEADERLYDVAARMLSILGYARVRLMTNNPDKVKALGEAGIRVVERVPHAFPAGEHNRDYLRAKTTKGGHIF